MFYLCSIKHACILAKRNKTLNRYLSLRTFLYLETVDHSSVMLLVDLSGFAWEITGAEWNTMLLEDRRAFNSRMVDAFYSLYLKKSERLFALLLVILSLLGTGEYRRSIRNDIEVLSNRHLYFYVDILVDKDSFYRF